MSGRSKCRRKSKRRVHRDRNQRQSPARDDAHDEPTARYEDTTRARTLAPKLAHLVETAKRPVTVMVTCGEPTQHERDRTAWDHALRDTARTGARIVHYLTPETSEEEAATARGLAEGYPQCECAKIEKTYVGKLALGIIRVILAWEGALEFPRQAILWIEWPGEPGGARTCAEFNDTQTLREHPGLLETFARTFEPAARASTED